MANFVWTKAGPAKVVEVDGNRMQIMLPGRKKAMWISKTQVCAAPKFLRLIKKVTFDQDCGCISVKDLHGTMSESYNVYGKLHKYVASNVKTGSELSPHMRRKQLHEKGFVRARGREDTMKDFAAKAYESLREGYKVFSSEDRKPRKAKPASPVAEAPVVEAVNTPEAVTATV